MAIRTFEEYRDITYEAVELYHKKKYKQALKKFLALAETNPTNLKVHEMLTYVYLQLGEYEKADEEYQIYLKLLFEQYPEMRRPRTFEEIVQDAGEYEEAKKSYENMIAHPMNYDMFEGMAIASRLSIHHMARGEYEKAEEVLLAYQQIFYPETVETPVGAYHGE
ncbi:MAG: hypothetical protein HPY78_02760 [Brevinematales bacterium]|jgi:Flp pilus assembly protein TadD|nr:hypothetical protein [Brevinematales bacterium]